MNIERIAAAVTELLDHSSTHAQRALAEAARWPAQIRDELADHYLAERLGETLALEPEFASGGYMIWHGSAGSGLFAEAAAQAILGRAKRTGNVVEAVTWFRDLIGRTEASGAHVMALWGVTVRRAIQLTATVSLVPITEIPETSYLKWLVRGAEAFESTPLAPWIFKTVPPSALVSRETVSPLITRQGDDRNYAGQLFYVEGARLASLLTCLGPSAPIVAASWFQFDEPDVQEAVLYGGLSTSAVGIVPFMPDAPLDLTDFDLADIAAQYLAAPKALRERLDVALERLNRAARTRSPADTALDLAIALEVLFADNEGENTFKVALRSAILEPDPSKKSHTRALASALYRLRSAIVHRGVAPATVRMTGAGHVPARVVCDQSLVLVSNVIRALLQRGTMPEWHDLEIGASGPPN